MAVTLILSLTRYRENSSQFRLMVQLKCAVLNRRLRFPPNAPQNLRAYRPTPESPLEFSQFSAMLGAGVIGAGMGWAVASALNIIILPPSLVALAVAVFSVLTSTNESPTGDLIRCAATKGVSVARLVISAATETEVPSTSLALAGVIGRKLSVLNAKYKIAERVGGGLSGVVDKVAGDAQNSRNAAATGKRRRRPRPNAAPQFPEVPYRQEY